MQRVEELLTVFPAVELTGARQVGKSTLLKMLADQLERPVRFANLDDSGQRAAADLDPAAFLQTEPGELVIIDEFQRVPKLAFELKKSIDENRQPGRYIISGSANLAAKQDSADSLAGRLVECRLYGFSQGELAGRKEDFVSAVVNGELTGREIKDLPTTDYPELLAVGSMPEAQGRTSRYRNMWIDSYLDRLLTRDVLDLSRLSDSLGIKTLLSELAATQGSEAIVSRLGSKANVGATTSNNYLRLLQALYLVERVNPWTPNLLKREVGRHKYAVMDTAIAMRLTGSTQDALRDVVKRAFMGGLLESFVTMELLRQLGWSEVDFSLSHYRSPDGREIDLIVQLPNQHVIGLEVKASTTIAAADFKHLTWLRDQIGTDLVAGIVLYSGHQIMRVAPQLWAVPVAGLWQVLEGNHGE